MLHITVAPCTEYSLTPHHPAGLIHSGGDAWGNGSIAWEKDGLFLYEIAQQIGVDQPLAAILDGELTPLDKFVTQDCELSFITATQAEGKSILQRTAIFLLAYSVVSLQKGYRRLQSSVIAEDTVCYDFMSPQGISFGDSEKEKLQLLLRGTLRSGKTITTKKLPYYTVKKLLTQANEAALIQKIDEDEEEGPITAQILDQFFELDEGLLLYDLSVIKDIQIIKTEQTATTCRIYGKIIL